MARISDAEIDEMILSVALHGRWPLSVPLSFRWTGDSIRLSTKRSRLHTKAFMETGRATAIVHYERYEPGFHLERYVTVEGPIDLVADSSNDPDVFVEAVLRAESVVGVVYDFSSG